MKHTRVEVEMETTKTMSIDDDINNDDENNNDFNDDVDGGTSEEEDAEDEDDWDPLQVTIGGDTYDRETVTDTQVGEV